MTEAKTHWRRRAALFAKIAVVAVIAYYVGRVIHENWGQIRTAEWDLKPGYLIASAALCSSWYWVRPLGWNLLINAFGTPVPYPAVFRVVRHSELSRFVPGGVWQIAGRVFLVKEWGVSASSAVAATVIDLVLTALAAMIPALWSLSTALPQFGIVQKAVFVAFPFVSIVVIHPKIFNWWAGFLFRRVGQSYDHLDIRWRTLLGIWTMYSLSWIAMCAGVAMFIRGVIELGPGGTAFMGSSYAAAWLAGSFAMISPAGMGIREGAFGWLLSRWIEAGPAFTLAVGVRLWVLLLEVAWVGVGALLPRPEPAPATVSTET